MTSVTQTPAWKALEEHHKKMKDAQMKDLFAKDGDRFKKFTASFNDILFEILLSHLYITILFFFYSRKYLVGLLQEHNYRRDIRPPPQACRASRRAWVDNQDV